jgi:transcriptional regulator with XRE-family HTH domain
MKGGMQLSLAAVHARKTAMLLTPSQLRAARALLYWSRKDLARRSGTAPETIQAFEIGASDPKLSTLRKWRLTLQKAGRGGSPAIGRQRFPPCRPAAVCMLHAEEITTTTEYVPWPSSHPRSSSRNPRVLRERPSAAMPRLPKQPQISGDGSMERWAAGARPWEGG